MEILEVTWDAFKIMDCSKTKYLETKNMRWWNNEPLSRLVGYLPGLQNMSKDLSVGLLDFIWVTEI